MHALNLYHSAHIAFPLHDDRTDLALVVGETDLPRGFCIGFALRGANQPQSFSHLSVLQQEGIHQVSALFWNERRERIGRHPQARSRFGYLESRHTGGFLSPFLSRKKQLSPSGEPNGGRRRPKPFHRPVGPVSQRPGIGRHRLSRSIHKRHHCSFRHFPFIEGNSESYGHGPPSLRSLR